MLLNAQWGKKELDVYNAMQTHDANIYKEVPVDAIFALSNNETVDYICLNNIVLFGVGMITNSEKLFQKCKINKKTNHEYEIIIHLYLKYGMDYLLTILEGYVSFVLLDHTNMELYPKIYVARDPLGSTPLWILASDENAEITHNEQKIHENLIAVSSNKLYLKRIINKREQNKTGIVVESGYQNMTKLQIKPFSPGAYMCYTHSEKTCTEWESKEKYQYYYSYPINYSINLNHITNMSSTTDKYLSCLLDSLKSYMRELKFTVNNDMSNVYFRIDGDIASIIPLAIAKLYYKNKLKTFTCGPVNAPWFEATYDISKMFDTDHIIISVSDRVQENISHSLEKEKINKEIIEGYSCAEHLSKYTNAEYVVLPIGADKCVLPTKLNNSLQLETESDIDIWERNMIVRESQKSYISKQGCVYMNEFWKQNIKTKAPFIDKAVLELWLTLGIQYNIHTHDSIRRLSQLAGITSIPENIKEIIDQSKTWNNLKMMTVGNMPSTTVIHTTTQSSCMYC